ncbi:hypothetical protein EI42_06299 [Thermosporothrix hazakensis]|jgi:hypothetical protein|uniref:Uncharacterized protein n=2 Tax=Thermosporothrix TaxID=768650 RepID=A0A326U3P7_THEHA|nr:hypothetical protein [Thermosporothrix hazakensis]PZW18217.1 hypothetical protein EI42_06299 [Thermosporothrix hazakensis]BBH87906.1 hypothetical protein KTC_26570 [Thermosporothrix sp. COM3]GCE50338.1 hypothetical protein KTH_52070 [Thermosporothrix hazakensis]
MFAEDIPQTISRAYQEILEGEAPWVAISEFAHSWFGYYPQRREELVREPIEPGETQELRQWAAFCAASVEYLCQKDQIACPDWVHNPHFSLPEPFYTHPLATRKPHIRERLEQEAPPAFAKRNVYCTNRVYANKYEAPPVRRRTA